MEVHTYVQKISNLSVRPLVDQIGILKGVWQGVEDAKVKGTSPHVLALATRRRKRLEQITSELLAPPSACHFPRRLDIRTLSKLSRVDQLGVLRAIWQGVDDCEVNSTDPRAVAWARRRRKSLERVVRELFCDN